MLIIRAQSPIQVLGKYTWHVVFNRLGQNSQALNFFGFEHIEVRIAHVASIPKTEPDNPQVHKNRINGNDAVLQKRFEHTHKCEVLFHVGQTCISARVHRSSGK